MNKKRTIIVVAIVAAGVGLYLLYRYIQNRAGSDSGTGALGSNLNSVAPELVGGSAGPSQGPAVDLPVNITLTTSDTSDRRGAVRPPYQTAGGATLDLMNTGVGSASGSPRAGAQAPGSPMRAASVHRSPVLAQSRAAGKVNHARAAGTGSGKAQSPSRGSRGSGAGASGQHDAAAGMHKAAKGGK